MDRRRRVLQRVAASAMAAALVACASSEEPYVERPVDALYNEALDHLQQGRHSEAVKAFDEVDPRRVVRS